MDYITGSFTGQMKGSSAFFQQIASTKTYRYYKIKEGAESLSGKAVGAGGMNYAGKSQV
ncbi:MAG: hypothetical protein IKO11_00895 [Lachnospiraceae bacterium]|nr:hypothetical protein [Lachnospiraceae bacterium]